MAKYKIVYDESQAAVFSRLATDIVGYESRLKMIANSMDSRDRSMATLRSQVKTAAETLPGVSTRLRREGEALGQSVAAYKKAETNAKTAYIQSATINVGVAITIGYVASVYFMTRIKRLLLENHYKLLLQPILAGIGAVVLNQEPNRPWWSEGITDKKTTDALSGATGGFENQKLLDDFINWVFDENNWTSKPGGATRGIDVDNYFGEQCADISKVWYMRMYGAESVSLSAWNDNGTVPMVNFPESSTMADVSGGPYAVGDIGFTINPPYVGHTFVVISNPDAEGNVKIIEQYYKTDSNPGGEPQIRTIPVDEITNGFRKK